MPRHKSNLVDVSSYSRTRSGADRLDAVSAIHLRYSHLSAVAPPAAAALAAGMAVAAAAFAESTHKQVYINLVLSLCLIILLTYCQVCSSHRARDSYIDDDYEQYYDAPAVSHVRPSPRMSSARTAIARRHDYYPAEMSDDDDIPRRNSSISRRRHPAVGRVKGRGRGGLERSDSEPIDVHCQPTTKTVCDKIKRCYGQPPDRARRRIGHQRIQGGWNPEPWLFVHFASLLDTNYEDGLYCGATLIGPYHLLTSAQCYPEPGHAVKVIIPHNEPAHRGYYGFIDANEGWCPAKKYAKKNYGYTHTFEHDWAVARINNVKHGEEDTVKPSCIPYKEKYRVKKTPEKNVLEYANPSGWFNPETDRCKAVGRGWYKAGSDEPKSPNDRKVHIINVRPVECPVQYVHFDLTKGLCFAAHDEKPNSGVCNHDIGGPVYCRNLHEGTWWVYGIISSFVNSTCSGPFFVTYVPAVVEDIMSECLQ